MRKNRKHQIMDAAVHLVAHQGIDGTSIRQIARAAGVTDGALYRHFASKNDLCLQAYGAIVDEMAAYKEKIVDAPVPLNAKIHEWVRVSYAYFDRYPDAFAYVLLTEHQLPPGWEDFTSRQGRLLLAMLADMDDPPTRPDLVYSHFSGVLLNIPRLIREGKLPGPAQQYSDEVARLLWLILNTAP